MVVLPTKKVPAKSTDPRVLVLYGGEKTGKTSALAQLDSNLIIDLEGGSEFIDAMAIQARTVNDLGEIAQAIRAKNTEVGHNFYKHITIDNATDLQEICLEYAAKLYKRTPQGKTWTGTDVREVARGAGYMYLREAVMKVITMFKELCDTIIIVGHYKDNTVNKNGEEVTERRLDLVGSLAGQVCRQADGVGYMYRKENEVHINFDGSENTAMGCRAEHLINQDIVISTMDNDRKLTTYWDKVFKED